MRASIRWNGYVDHMAECRKIWKRAIGAIGRFGGGKSPFLQVSLACHDMKLHRSMPKGRDAHNQYSNSAQVLLFMAHRLGN